MMIGTVEVHRRVGDQILDGIAGVDAAVAPDHLLWRLERLRHDQQRQAVSCSMVGIADEANCLGRSADGYPQQRCGNEARSPGSGLDREAEALHGAHPRHGVPGAAARRRDRACGQRASDVAIGIAGGPLTRVTGAAFRSFLAGMAGAGASILAACGAGAGLGGDAGRGSSCAGLRFKPSFGRSAFGRSSFGTRKPPRL
jgi:hypothetical protein